MVGKVKTISCHVSLLDSTPFETSVEKRSRGAVLFAAVCKELNLLETDYFGLSFTDGDGVKYWLNMEKRIRKQLGKRPMNFKLEVKFYPPEPTQLQEDITRYQLCLQIREDIISEKLQCSAITLALLGSYTVQAELGDYDAREHGNPPDYVRSFLFSQDENLEILEKTAELHRQHMGQTPAETEYRFLEIAKKLPMYGVHLHDATDSEGVALSIGVSADGIHVYRDTLRINRFVWPKVLHVSYKKKLFYIKVRPAKFEQFQSTIGFKTSSHAMAKRLWKEAVDHHSFFRRKERQVEPGTFSTLTRLGSRYRYSGRTQHESRQKAATIERPQPLFERTASRISSRNRRRKEEPHIPIAGGPMNDSLSGPDHFSDSRPMAQEPESDERPYAIRSAKSGAYADEEDLRGELDLGPAPEPPVVHRPAQIPRGGEGRVYDHVPVEEHKFEAPAYDHVPVEEADLDLPSVPTQEPSEEEPAPRRTAASVDI